MKIDPTSRSTTAVVIQIQADTEQLYSAERGTLVLVHVPSYLLVQVQYLIRCIRIGSYACWTSASQPGSDLPEQSERAARGED